MEFDDLQLNLILLDAALTDHPWNHVAHGAAQKQWTAEQWLSGVYYLSDGGYSRIAFDEEAGKIFLTSESLERPKQLWPAMSRIIAEIEGIVRSTFLEWDEPL